MAEEAVCCSPGGTLQLMGGTGNTLKPATKQAAWAPQSFNPACTTKTHSPQEIHLLVTMVLSFKKAFFCISVCIPVQQSSSFKGKCMYGLYLATVTFLCVWNLK